MTISESEINSLAREVFIRVVSNPDFQPTEAEMAAQECFQVAEMFLKVKNQRRLDDGDFDDR